MQAFRSYRWLPIVFAVCVIASAQAADAGNGWRDARYAATLRNEALEATFQSGVLVRLKDLVRNKVLINVDPASVPDRFALFGNTGIRLSGASVKQQLDKTSLQTDLDGADGKGFSVKWSVEPGHGDLVADFSARSAQPVDQLRMLMFGCDLGQHSMTIVDACGGGRSFRAPWQGEFRDPATAKFMFSPRYVHPLLALFEGDGGGWVIEGRDPNIGPANLFALGRGKSADLFLMRGFPAPTKTPQLFPIRLRVYSGAWQDAVDPFRDWMQQMGYVPLEQKSPAWVNQIRSQAYVDVGDFAGLEALAKRLNPSKTLLGRMGGMTRYAWDHGYPDYQPTDVAKRWVKRARELGFHVGTHINTTGIDPQNPALLERFRKGFMTFTTDASGNETTTDPPPCHSGRVNIEVNGQQLKVWGVPPTIVYSSTANPDWRAYLTEQLRPMIDAGVDMIYLDESGAPAGKFIVDDTTAIQGVMALEQKILETYPQVAIETEEYNPMNARHSSFALTTLDLGHPLGGYLFGRFIKIVPEAPYYQATDVQKMDQSQSFGFMLPGADSEESWLQIAGAFQKYNLQPDSRLPRNANQLSGWHGDKVTAYYEKKPNRRGLVVYEKDREPIWFGTRITGVTTWPGPGSLPGWLVYDGPKLLALDPHQTYVFQPSIKNPLDQFHVSSIPAGFQLYTDDDRRIFPQVTGKDGSFYKVTFTGSGQIALHVPANCVAILEGQEIPIDRQGGDTTLSVSAPADEPCVILVFVRSDAPLAGKWVDLPWQTKSGGEVVAQGDGFFNHVGGRGQIIGKLPAGKRLRLVGSYGMGSRPMSVGDGVVRINGKEVLRVPPGEEPYSPHTFDADISSFAGQNVLMEFGSEGKVHGPSPANWYAPRIVVEP